MLISHRSLAVAPGSIARHALAAVVTTFTLCTPALSQTTPPNGYPSDIAESENGELGREAARVGMEGVLVTYREVARSEQVTDAMARHAVTQIAVTQIGVAQAAAAKSGTSHGRTRRQRLGRWAIIPGVFLGAMLGGAVDCLVTRCTSNIPTGVVPGMLVGAATTALAPRRVAGTFLGVGGGFVAGSLIGPAIEGDCRSDHPCNRGALVGETVGATAGGLLGYRMSGQ